MININDPVQFCEQLYEKAETIANNRKGIINAGDLLLAVDRIKNRLGTAKDADLRMIVAGVKGSGKNRKNIDEKATIRLIAKLYEKASEKAVVTPELKKLGDILVRESYGSLETKRAASVASARFRRVDLGKTLANAPWTALMQVGKGQSRLSPSPLSR